MQALAAFNIYFVGNSETSREAMGKFLHNMSYQALNKENDHILMEFDKTSNLIIELINLLLDKNTVSLSGDKKKTENVINTINDYQFVFDVPPALQIHDKVEKNIKNYEKPDILPDFSPEPLLKTEDMEQQSAKKNQRIYKIIFST